MPSPRPRFTNGHVYMPREYTQHVDVLALSLLAHRPRPWDRAALFSVTCEFSLSRRQGRSANDIDNLLKTVLDAGTGVLWNDDRQIVECYLRKHERVVDSQVGIELRVSPIG
jgi:Holliday junction resolvase RusA-like endonuclease